MSFATHNAQTSKKINILVTGMKWNAATAACFSQKALYYYRVDVELRCVPCCASRESTQSQCAPWFSYSQSSLTPNVLQVECFFLINIHYHYFNTRDVIVLFICAECPQCFLWTVCWVGNTVSSHKDLLGQIVKVYTNIQNLNY